MKNSVECIKILQEEFAEDWKKRLDTYLKNEGAEEDEDNGNDAIPEFINAFKEDIISAQTENVKEVEQIIDNELLFEDVKVYVDDILEVYYAAEPLRILEKKNYALATKAVDCIFSEMILRFNRDIDEKYEKLGFLSKEAFIDVIGVLSSLTIFVVRNSMFLDTICDVIYQNVRLSKKMCQYISNKVNEDFERIQLKLIMEKLYEDA